jgi:hypothetical protein
MEEETIQLSRKKRVSKESASKQIVVEEVKPVVEEVKPVEPVKPVIEPVKPKRGRKKRVEEEKQVEEEKKVEPVPLVEPIVEQPKKRITSMDDVDENVFNMIYSFIKENDKDVPVVVKKERAVRVKKEKVVEDSEKDILEKKIAEVRAKISDKRVKKTQKQNEYLKEQLESLMTELETLDDDVKPVVIPKGKQMMSKHEAMKQWGF